MSNYFGVWLGSQEKYIKIVCNDEGFELVKGLGFTKDFHSLPAKEADIKKPEGLDALKSKDEIEAYVKEKTGVDIDKRGSFETVKEKAKAVLNESGRADT